MRNGTVVKPAPCTLQAYILNLKFNALDLIDTAQRFCRLRFGWLSKLWSLFGSLIYYGTYYLGYPKRDPNFDNYLFGFRVWAFGFRP